METINNLEITLEGKTYKRVFIDGLINKKYYISEDAKLIVRHKNGLIKERKYNVNGMYCGYTVIVRTNLVSSKQRWVYIHRMLVAAWKTPTQNYDFDGLVNHVDGKKKNNTLSNLEVISNRNNILHSRDGYNYVYPTKNGKRYKVTVNNYYVGTFDTEVEASQEVYEYFMTDEDGIPMYCKFHPDIKRKTIKEIFESYIIK